MMKMTQTKAIPAAKMRKMPIRFASPRAVRPSPRHPFVMSYKSTKLRIILLKVPFDCT